MGRRDGRRAALLRGGREGKMAPVSFRLTSQEEEVGTVPFLDVRERCVLAELIP